mmetsp:Transcript_2483/g.4746  ORF Transcript_2483/g.4746 Transcript_2483/m.4746 type:complete len:217 (-) Transcript_2483:35-685(-)
MADENGSLADDTPLLVELDAQPWFLENLDQQQGKVRVMDITFEPLPLLAEDVPNVVARPTRNKLRLVQHLAAPIATRHLRVATHVVVVVVVLDSVVVVVGGGGGVVVVGGGVGVVPAVSVLELQAARGVLAVQAVRDPQLVVWVESHAPKLGEIVHGSSEGLALQNVGPEALGVSLETLSTRGQLASFRDDHRPKPQCTRCLPSFAVSRLCLCIAC